MLRRRSRKRCRRITIVLVSATLALPFLYVLYQCSLLILSMNVPLSPNRHIPFRVATTLLSSLPLLGSANERRCTPPLLRPLLISCFLPFVLRCPSFHASRVLGDSQELLSPGECDAVDSQRPSRHLCVTIPFSSAAPTRPWKPCRMLDGIRVGGKIKKASGREGDEGKHCG